jgi:transposase
MKAYSTDLRQKIIETKLETQETDKKIAERFRVSRSFVNKLVRQYQRSGNYEPLPHRGGAQPQFTREKIAIVIELVEEDNDATLQQLSDRPKWISCSFHL